MLAAALAFVVIAGLVLGIKLTVWTVLLFALPLMMLFGLIATWWQSRRKRQQLNSSIWRVL